MSEMTIRKFSLSHLTSVEQISLDDLQLLLDGADMMKQLVSSSGGDDRLKGKVLATIFYEPSTRTACSFIAAMQRLGGSVIPIYEQTSSVKKGESFEDTIRTLASFADAIVLRHPMKGSAVTASSVSSKPVINAGDGAGEHPTQALLDMYTIRSELGRIGGETERGVPMVIAFVGDLKNGRTVHSLSLLLARYAGDSLHFVFVSPPSLSLPDYIRDRLAQANTTQEHVESLDEVIRRADVLYMTRIQRERFETEEEYNTVFGCYCLDAKLMIRAKDRMIVMHPLPRLNEIHTDVDSDPRAAYFRQMENGMFMRMSVLSLTLLGRV